MSKGLVLHDPLTKGKWRALEALCGLHCGCCGCGPSDCGSSITITINHHHQWCNDYDCSYGNLISDVTRYIMIYHTQHFLIIYIFTNSRRGLPKPCNSCKIVYSFWWREPYWPSPSTLTIGHYLPLAPRLCLEFRPSHPYSPQKLPFRALWSKSWMQRQSIKGIAVLGYETQ